MSRTDGRWGFFSGSFQVLYNALSNGDPSPLIPLSVHYADYAVWQREWFAGEILEKQLSYWRKQLENLSPLELPTDRPRPAVQTYLGGRQSIVLSEDLSKRLNSLSRKQGATVFMTLLASCQILLHRYTAQDDVAVGSPIAGRNRPEIEPLIGCFLNTLVLRADLSRNPAFTELLGRVREMCLEAYAHQDIPFEKVLEELRPVRDLSHSPLFQLFFNMVNVGRSRLGISGVKTQRLPTSGTGSKLDLTIYARQQDDRIHFDLVYNVDLFDESRMEELLRQYQGLLAQIVEHPGERIDSYSLVTPVARELLPNPVEPLHSVWVGAVHEHVSHMARRPDPIAIADPQDSWTYAELNARSNQLAHYLVENGIRREDVVAIYADRSASIVWAVIGVPRPGRPS